MAKESTMAQLQGQLKTNKKKNKTRNKTKRKNFTPRAATHFCEDISMQTTYTRKRF